MDEIQRLKTAIGNKDSQNQSLEEMLKLERERREGENGEIRSLLYQEQEKALQAAREAEKFSTQIKMHKEQADRAIFDLDRKNEQLESMQQKVIENHSDKNAAHEGLLFKFENDKKDLEDNHRDAISSMQIKLNNKETDIYKMEQLLLQLNHSVDQAKQGKEEIKTDLDMCKIEKIRIEERSTYLKE